MAGPPLSGKRGKHGAVPKRPGVPDSIGSGIRGVLITAPMSGIEGKADMYRWVRDYRF